MEQQQEIPNLKRILYRRKWWLTLPAIGVIITAALVALLLPNVFKSTAVILIQSQQIPSDLVPSTVTSYADQRIQTITQEVKSRSKILSLVEKYDLLPENRKKLATEDLVDRIRKRISIEPINAQINKEGRGNVQLTIAFTLSYEDKLPKKAQLVATEIASYYMEKNLESRSRDARGTSEFLQAQLKQVKEEIDGLETRLARYREAHLEDLPEYTSLNMQKVEKLNADLSNVNMQIRSLEEQRSSVRNSLAAQDPFSAASGGRVLSPEERLQQAQMERAELVSKYSEKHPVTQAKNREIELLEKQVKETGELPRVQDRLKELETKLADLNSRYSDLYPEVRSTTREIEKVKEEIEALQARAGQPNPASAEGASNPAYVAMKSDLDRTEISIASLKAEKTRLEQLSKVLYDKLHAMPQVAIEYNQLNTDYQNAKVHYNETQQKLLAAQVSQGMEEGKLGETFQIVEPAFLPEEPFKPNRLAILLIGVVLGIGMSVGLASLREYSDKRVHDMKGLEQCSGMPVFSVIPRIVTREELTRSRKRKIVITAGAVCGIALALVAFHFLVMDLYVLHAKVMRLLRSRLLL